MLTVRIEGCEWMPRGDMMGSRLVIFPPHFDNFDVVFQKRNESSEYSMTRYDIDGL